MTIGPLLTLNIFDRRKKSLRSDLKSGQAGSALAFVPPMGREGAMTALLDRRDARLIAVLPVDPY